MPRMTGSAAPIKIRPSVELTAPGLIGTVVELPPRNVASRSLRAPGPMFDVLERVEQATERTGQSSDFTFMISPERDIAPPSEGSRSAGPRTRSGEAAVRLSIPSRGKFYGHAVLTVDEDGVSHWVLPENAAVGRQLTRGQTVVFHLPRPTQLQSPDVESRGPIIKWGRQVVRLFTWKSDEILGAGILKVAQWWEEQNRPYGFRGITASGIGQEPNWNRLGQGRALLLLHGTFSSAEGTFPALVTDPQFQGLRREHYDRRVFAFNHPSLHHNPTRNAEELLTRLPDNLPRLELDVLTHSRGGLVGRVLANLATRPNSPIRVHNLLMVAAPNQGTVLTDGENWLDFVDSYTNMLTLLPDTKATLILEGVLTAVKLLAHGALAGLPGLASMIPSGRYLRDLNDDPATPAALMAISADFTPAETHPLKRLRDALRNKFADTIFGQGNDVVVPTAGGYMTGSTGAGFPLAVERFRVFEGEVDHHRYFSTPEVVAVMTGWLRQ